MILAARWRLRSRATVRLIFAESTDAVTATARSAVDELDAGIDDAGKSVRSTPLFVMPELGVERVTGPFLVAGTWVRTPLAQADRASALVLRRGMLFRSFVLSIALLASCQEQPKDSPVAGARVDASTGIAPASAAPPGVLAPAPEVSAPASAGGAASVSQLFAGAPGDGVTLSAAVPARVGDLWIQAPVGWSLNTSPDLGWELLSPDRKARLELESTGAGTPPEVPTDGLRPGRFLEEVQVEAASEGTIGRDSLPALIGGGSARIHGQKDRGRLYYFVVRTGGESDVKGLALIRAGASPAVEAGLMASIRSLGRADSYRRRNGGAVP